MKRIFKLLTIVILSSFLLTGCYPTGEKKIPSSSVPEDEQNNSLSSSDIVQSSSNGKKTYSASFDYQIPSDIPDQVPKIKLKPKVLDAERTVEVLLGDRTIPGEVWYSGGTRYTTPDGKVLITYAHSFLFEDKSVMFSQTPSAIVLSDYNWEYYISGDEFKNFSRKEAVERVNSLFDELGIENYGEPAVISVSPESANEILISTNGFGKGYTLWDENDGVYILKYPLNVNGLNTAMSSVKIAGRTVYQPTITVHVAKDAVFYISMDLLYEVVSDDEGMAEIRFDALYASNELKDHYSKLLLSDPVFFTECRLEYIPFEQKENSEVIFAPAWCFLAYELFNETRPNDIYTYYYAETGIRWGGY